MGPRCGAALRADPGITCGCSVAICPGRSGIESMARWRSNLRYRSNRRESTEATTSCQPWLADLLSSTAPVLRCIQTHQRLRRGVRYSGLATASVRSQRPAQPTRSATTVRTMEMHRKRYRGPRAIRPFASLLITATRHLPHWARPLKEAADRAIFETTIVTPPGDAPPPAGVREPRRPKPTDPTMSRALDTPPEDTILE